MHPAASSAMLFPGFPDAQPSCTEALAEAGRVCLLARKDTQRDPFFNPRSKEMAFGMVFTQFRSLAARALIFGAELSFSGGIAPLPFSHQDARIAICDVTLTLTTAAILLS